MEIFPQGDQRAVIPGPHFCRRYSEASLGKASHRHRQCLRLGPVDALSLSPGKTAPLAQLLHATSIREAEMPKLLLMSLNKQQISTTL